MNFATTYVAGPSRAEIDELAGLTVIEFGTSWCGICRAAQPLIREQIESAADGRHLKVEDGPGKPLGRSFGVKLWPTLVLIRDGQEVARSVRPSSRDDVAALLARSA